MELKEEKYLINERSIIIRSARLDEAQILIDYIKCVTGETRFLMCESDEINFTIEQEEMFINEHNESKNSLLMLAFVDGEYAGNCTIDAKVGSRRYNHRAGIGIALYQKYTGFGLGLLMLKRLIEIAKELSYEQLELSCYEKNDRALHLYTSLGFKECGRMPNASKYDDGTYSDEINMVMQL